MKTHRLAIGVLLVAALCVFSGCALLDVGLDYERATIHANQSFSVADASGYVLRDFESYFPGLIAFHESDTHVLQYVVGRGHSRVTSAHGYHDEVLIEFREDPDRGDCTVLRGAYLGYRRGGQYGIRASDDIWVKIGNRCTCHGYHVTGAVKITRRNEEGFDPSDWDVITIRPQRVKPNQRMQRE